MWDRALPRTRAASGWEVNGTSVLSREPEGTPSALRGVEFETGYRSGGPVIGTLTVCVPVVVRDGYPFEYSHVALLGRVVGEWQTSIDTDHLLNPNLFLAISWLVERERPVVHRKRRGPALIFLVSLNRSRTPEPPFLSIKQNTLNNQVGSNRLVGCQLTIRVFRILTPLSGSPVSSCSAWNVPPGILVRDPPPSCVVLRRIVRLWSPGGDYAMPLVCKPETPQVLYPRMRRADSRYDFNWAQAIVLAFLISARSNHEGVMSVSIHRYEMLGSKCEAVPTGPHRET